MAAVLIFDFDGVIADSEALANQVLADCITELGVPTTLHESYKTYMGKRFPDVMAAIERTLGSPLPDDFPEKFQERTLNRFRTDLQPVPGVMEFLKTFDDVPKCIASSSSPDRLALCLEVLGLADTFGRNVFSASMVQYGKPAPDIFLHAVNKMQSEPREAIIIEDSASGVEAGVAAGVTVIGILAASHIQNGDGEKLTRAGAHHVVENFSAAEIIVRQHLTTNL